MDIITFFNREEIYTGHSIEQFSKIRQILVDNNIKYDYKCISPNRTRQPMGGFGENLSLLYEYHIFVHKDDCEEACYIINNAR